VSSLVKSSVFIIEENHREELFLRGLPCLLFQKGCFEMLRHGKSQWKNDRASLGIFHFALAWLVVKTIARSRKPFAWVLKFFILSSSHEKETCLLVNYFQLIIVFLTNNLMSTASELKVLYERRRKKDKKDVY